MTADRISCALAFLQGLDCSYLAKTTSFIPLRSLQAPAPVSIRLPLCVSANSDINLGPKTYRFRRTLTCPIKTFH